MTSLFFHPKTSFPHRRESIFFRLDFVLSAASDAYLFLLPAFLLAIEQVLTVHWRQSEER